MKCVRLAVLIALAALSGCGDEQDRVSLVRVTGTITRNGKPLANAKVSFMPDAGNKVSTPSVDETGPEGNYMLRFKGRTGVASGKYKVMITPAVEVPASAKIPEEFRDDPLMGSMAAGVGVPGAGNRGGGAAAKKKEVIKEESVEIDEKDSSREFDFDVKG